MGDLKIISVIEYNGEIFKEGDIISYKLKGLITKRTGRIVSINEQTNIITLDESQKYRSRITRIKASDMLSITREAEGEE